MLLCQYYSCHRTFLFTVENLLRHYAKQGKYVDVQLGCLSAKIINDGRLEESLLTKHPIIFANIYTFTYRHQILICDSASR